MAIHGSLFSDYKGEPGLRPVPPAEQEAAEDQHGVRANYWAKTGSMVAYQSVCGSRTGAPGAEQSCSSRR